MKNQTAKRLFAFLMVLMLVATALPVQALAAEEHVHQESTEALQEAPAVQVEEPAAAPALEDILGAFADFADAYALTPEMTEKQLRAVRGSFPSEEAVAACAAEIEAIALQAELLTAEEQEALIADETVQLVGRFHAVLVAKPAKRANTTITSISGVSITGDSGAMTVSGANVTFSFTGGLLSATTKTFTIQNTTGSKATVSFTVNYTTGTSLTIDGTSYSTGTKAFSKELDVDGTITVKLSYKGLTSKCKLVLENISAAAAVDSSNITIAYDSAYGSVTAGGNAVAAGDVVTITDSIALVAAPASGATFLGWVDASGKILGNETTYTATSTGDQTIQAVFVGANSPAWFSNYGYMGIDLNAIAANGGTKVVLLNSGVLGAGTYTIPTGVTLLIPYDAANTLHTTAPGDDKLGLLQGEATYVTPTVYRKLTMADGATINVEGGLSLSAKMHAGGTKKNIPCGGPTGPVSVIHMNDGAVINVNSGAGLYAWGFITGKGNVYAHNGSDVYELFQIMDFRGGTESTSSEMKTYEVFPMHQYYIQNIEAYLTIYSGATEHSYTGIVMSKTGVTTSVAFMAQSNAMFNLTAGSVTKWYDGTTDRLHISMNEGSQMNVEPVSLKIGTSDLDAADYNLPITNNISLTAKSGSKLTMNQKIVMLPGAEVTVESGAQCILANGVKVYVMDADQWGPYASSHRQYLVPVAYAPGRTYTRTQADLKDAKIQVAGTLNASAGYAYTTEGGANICGVEGGKVITNTSYGDGKLHMAIYYTAAENQAAGRGKEAGSIFPEMVANPVRLLNADGTYISPSETHGTVVYTNGQWVCENGNHKLTEDKKDATCTEDGYVHSTCACGYDVTSEIAATGHSYSVVENKPTCDTDGSKVYTCATCGHSYEEILSATGHNHTLTAEQAATCTEDGYKTYTCSCGDSYTETVKAPGHNETVTVVAPTCTAQGYTAYTCSVCGNVRKDSYVDATGHNCGEGEITKAPTCTDDGVRTFSCANCDYSYTEAIKASGHKYGEEATCTTPQVCMVCSAELAAALGHKEVIDSAVPATCTETGLTEGKHCSVCNTVLVKQDVVDALGHSFTDWTVTVQPTYTAEGTQQRTCINGNHTETKPVPVLKMVNLWNLVLGEGIRMNFVANVTADQAENATVEVVVNGTSETFAMNNLPVNEEGFAMVTANVSAAQMTDTVTLNFTVNGEQVTKEYTVRQYADYVLDDANGFDDVTKALVQAMLHYGAAAQDYFDYNEGSFANLNISDTVNNAIQNVEAVPATGETAGIVHYGSTLVYRDKVAVRVYFKLTGDAAIGDYTFIANGENVKVNEGSNGLYYVEVADIAPQNLDKAVTVVVNGGLTVTYSPLNYICRMFGKTDDAALKILLQQLYDYYVAAAAYTAK
ncbi:MAG: hypothetical protein IJZ48_05270 [Oscillospiraceae bacterium]|nr:hypothetical protein [Oscillospiraceae bacterium]